MRKNILIFAHNAATQFIDIVNQYVNLFDQSQYKVTVAYLSGEKTASALERTQAEEIIFLNFSKKSIRSIKLKAIRTMLGLCRERNFDIVICQRYKPSYIMLWVAQFCKIRLLFFVMHAMHTMNSLGRKALIAALVRPNMYFAGVSNAVRCDLKHSLWRVPASRIITLYNSIAVDDTESKLFSKSQARDALGLPHDSFIFGTTGRLAREKDQKNLITAFAKVLLQYPQARLVLIGDGPLENDLKELTTSLAITDKVIFTGFITSSFRYMKAFDVFVLCSVKEAFGRVLLEAMVARVPVIGTQICGIPEVIGDSGNLVTPSHSDELAQAMLATAKKSSSELSDLGDKVYHQVQQHFSLTRFKQDFWAMPVLQTIFS